MKWIALGALIFLAACTTVKNKDLYHSDDLTVRQLSPHTYVHESFLQTESWGKVSCNGMIFIKNDSAIVFDTPSNDSVSDELIDWLEKVKKAKIIAVVVNHFHGDCLGGLKAFHSKNIPSYASERTREYAAADSVNKPEVPQVGFGEERLLHIGNTTIINRFFGEGHTRDNIVSYIPDEEVLFGGCLIKEEGADEGYLGDANVQAWPATVAKIKESFPDVQYVIPGHGKVGDKGLLDYTIRLFSKQ